MSEQQSYMADDRGRVGHAKKARPIRIWVRRRRRDSDAWGEWREHWVKYPNQRAAEDAVRRMNQKEIGFTIGLRGLAGRHELRTDAEYALAPQPARDGRKGGGG